MLGNIIRNCLYNVDIRNERRCGNSIRQIDKAIQILHEDSIVHIVDHFENGTNEIANQRLLKRVESRLYNEKMTHLYKGIIIDEIECTIRKID